ncbi:MAG: dienelactone hydrolase family protein [Rhodoferax sp.]|uniref:dienelactone hydrolase family protein n=1 Tax=Rhodoferax sp. TaxID=50421 RepID=UPI0008AFC81E|nr:dienelactone hydrolase family protein [Rhodoferax sp.]MDP2679128.1 dienelactone hydrolase family protein [Rhodoferax sp.]OGB50804.1 MAG: carboxymethylenebutenolidase [Burkholderiales bacterium RIFOXYD12_FULL_59_19]OGB82083.1 MAG: carboxymethylenebutenolidase [Burkholderiales bacterium RIFOXYD2_FULL_59_8]
MSHFVNLTSSDGFVFPAYVAKPTGPVRGGLVLMQEIFGLNAHIRATAEAYAAQGYLTVAPATFHRVQADVDMGYTPDDIAAGVKLKAAVEDLPAPGVMPDMAAAMAYAAQAGRVGIMGYCWGGLLAWRAASQLPGLSAAVAYYGGGMTTPAEVARQARCPVLCHFGEFDHAIPVETARAFALAHPELTVHIYPAQHGFNCDHRAAYDPAAAALAKERTLAFLALHLG